jgi:hypothetical protein
MAIMRTALLLTTLLGTGCAEHRLADPAAPVADCYTSANLLRNPEFAVDAGGIARPWASAQHAGERSFELRLQSGAARIEKTGTQPWFSYTQIVPVRPLRGEDLVYTAEMAMALTAEGVAHGFDIGGGLVLSVWGDPDPVMGGDRLLATHLFDHEPHLGDSDWVPVHMRVRIPETATRMRVGFAQYANGWMALRNPKLFRCSAGS